MIIPQNNQLKLSANNQESCMIRMEVEVGPIAVVAGKTSLIWIHLNEMRTGFENTLNPIWLRKIQLETYYKDKWPRINYKILNYVAI